MTTAEAIDPSLGLVPPLSHCVDGDLERPLVVRVESIVAGGHGEYLQRLADRVELDCPFTQLPTTSRPPG